MIQLNLKHFHIGTPALNVRRALYRATCLDGKVRYGYLCIEVRRHLFRPADERIYLREDINGHLHRFHPETLAISTLLKDENGKPICNGDYVDRWDNITFTKMRGQICYCTDIAAFVFRSTDSRYPHTDILYKDETVVNDNREYKLHYTYVLVDKRNV